MRDSCRSAGSRWSLQASSLLHVLVISVIVPAAWTVDTWLPKHQPGQHSLHVPALNISLPLVPSRHCIARLDAANQPGPSDSSHSVVLTFCGSHHLEGLSSLRCTIRGVPVRYFVYQTCKTQMDGLPESIHRIKRCSKMGKRGLRSHGKVVLHHIVAHWDILPKRILFASAAALASAKRAKEAVADGLLSTSEFKALWKPSHSRSMVQAACHLIQRYTCMDTCSGASIEWPASQAYFSVSGNRIRSLDVHEYSWLKQRHHLAPGIWPFIFGCPNALNSPEGAECAASESFSGGIERSNPYELAYANAMQPPALRVLPQECVSRDTSEKPLPLDALQGPKIGVVLVLCNEDLSTLRDIECNGADPETALHIFSKCAVPREVVMEQLGPVARCVRTFKSVPVTLETELAWTKHHREYLEFIIQRYSILEPMTLFVKANFYRRRLDLKDMIRDAIDNHWAFKSYGGPKIHVDLTGFPENGNQELWKSEMCALYRRYVCMDVCAPSNVLEAHRVTVPLYNTRSMWVASAARIRSLQVTEYQWWREYISNIPLEEGVARRFVLERLWQVLLGCPEEHITANLVGCTHRQWHPHGFAVGPPPELASQLKGSLQPHPLVQWPQPPLELFDPDKPYPNFKALGTPGNQSLSVSRPAITFVISVTQAMGRPASVVQASAVAAARFHANCRFVLLAEEHAKSELLSEEFWGGRMEVHFFKAGNQQRSFGWLHAAQPSPVTRMELELQFLKHLNQNATEQQRCGHVVFMGGSAVPISSLMSVFESAAEDNHFHSVGERNSLQQTSRISIIYAPGSAMFAVDETWFVPMGRTGEAVQLLQVVVQKSQGHSTKPGDSRDWDQLLDCCLEMIPDPIETSPVLAACDTSKCGLSQGTTVTLQLLPCSTWLASLGGSRTQSCPVAGAETRQITFPSQEVQSHLNAVLKIKDKSSGRAALKASVLDFLKHHGKELSDPLLMHYIKFLNSTAMQAVWMPPEKRGPPIIGPVENDKEVDSLAARSLGLDRGDVRGVQL